MKKLIATFLLTLAILLSIGFAVPKSADAAVRVKGYIRSNGTYVATHYRSNPDSSKLNNWSTKGNYNIYTGKKGYKSW